MAEWADEITLISETEQAERVNDKEKKQGCWLVAAAKGRSFLIEAYFTR